MEHIRLQGENGMLDRKDYIVVRNSCRLEAIHAQDCMNCCNIFRNTLHSQNHICCHQGKTPVVDTLKRMDIFDEFLAS
jgi:hypothetical protein